MLLPLSGSKFNNRIYNFVKIIKEKEICDSSHKSFNSIYDTNSISFTHYMGLKDNSDITSNPDYFKLPKITLKDGTIHQLTPDKSQIECAQRLMDGDSVVYCAPTGTGKTAVAHFAVNKNLDEDKKTYITVPLVALANDKYREFCKIYGSDKVGVMTGDRKVNINAPIVIMTTEILYNQSEELKNNTKNIGTIVFDEAHYMADEDRGSVWENSLISSVPNNIQVLCLSATIGNSSEFNSWIESLNPTQKASLVEVKPQERYVPLVWQVYNPENQERFIPVIQYAIDIENLNAEELSDKQKRAISKIYQIQKGKNEFYEPSLKELKSTVDFLQSYLRDRYQSVEDFEDDFSSIQPKFNHDEVREIAHLLRDEDDKLVKKLHVGFELHDNFINLINDMQNNGKLPAIIFKLSRFQCDDLVENFYYSGLELTSEEEKKEIEQIIDKYQQTGYLGKDISLYKEEMMNGYASHHAGKLPHYRKLVEELFSKKLLKVVAATSTLGAGINMPARSVVMSDMSYKTYNPNTKEMESKVLTVNEFHQMAGRAGRRGVDNVGNVILYNLRSIPKKYKQEEHNKNRIDEEELAYQYIDSKPDNLRSQFRPDAVMIARYYNEHNDNKGLYALAGASFKWFSAEFKEQLSSSLIKKFENYAQILLKQGYLYRDHKNIYTLTPKGKLLLNAQGANPIMVTSLIYDGLLEDLTPESLAQISGYIAGSDDIREPDNVEEEIAYMLESEFQDNPKPKINDFFRIKNIYKQKEERVLRSLKESKIPLNDIISSDNLSGYVLYLWAQLNQGSSDFIKNFETIISSKHTTEDVHIERMLNAKLSEGNVYRIIAHSISVLKQIQKICDYALSNPEDYPNSGYYEDLKANAELALELINQPPINAEDIE